MVFRTPQSKRGADRQRRGIMARMRREDGYQMFGYDWPTLRITRPNEYMQLKEITRLYNSLPD